jgi:hypothetical protein
MSYSAQNMIELQRLAQGGAGALTQHLLREMATCIITAGVADARDIAHASPPAGAAAQCEHFVRGLVEQQAWYLYADDEALFSPLLQIEL